MLKLFQHHRNSVGVTLDQSIRSCGNNCPPKPQHRTMRSEKLKYKNEYKRKLIQLEYMKLVSMQEQASCPL